MDEWMDDWMDNGGTDGYHKKYIKYTKTDLSHSSWTLFRKDSFTDLTTNILEN